MSTIRPLPSCAALVLHHNNRVLLEPLFDSLLGQEALSAICLIDNASNDDSVAYTREHHPQVEIIQNQENLDFGTAYNRAIEVRNEDVIFIANNDIVVRPGSIRNALTFLQDNPDVASVSFEGLDPKRSNPFPCECRPLIRFGKELSPARRFAGPNDPPVESPGYLWGAAACVRTEVLKKIRFDETMDWGFEDIDLGWSISRQTGMRNVFLPSATIYHLESHTVKARFRQWQIRRMLARNAILCFTKNATAGELLRALPHLIFGGIISQKRMSLAGEVARRLRVRLMRTLANRPMLVLPAKEIRDDKTAPHS
jgi:GT2 family glycosyltransferase